MARDFNLPRTPPGEFHHISLLAKAIELNKALEQPPAAEAAVQSASTAEVVSQTDIQLSEMGTQTDLQLSEMETQTELQLSEMAVQTDLQLSEKDVQIVGQTPEIVPLPPSTVGAGTQTVEVSDMGSDAFDVKLPSTRFRTWGDVAKLLDDAAAKAAANPAPPKKRKGPRLLARTSSYEILQFGNGQLALQPLVTSSVQRV
jgi:hypothetical protein